ncbi:MAG: Transposase [uncultured Sulfurovum sp.]|uniref:Transposase n=1 Tax=uncultured Sulfurovum sp. TaxID=269237 RepID=A0A6S6U8F1_9BACT|nr:MAG: Transposase [uncultured Sulfurovum sp.]
MSNIYKQGEHRKQQMLFPPSIDEYVSEDNTVRAIDDYVELLDMVELRFTKSALNSADGQPAYHPKLLLKIYIYGYLNKIRSSRKLEQEIKRNIEMMWLCTGLIPSNKTISNFRKENAKPLKKVFREFVLLCKELELITGELVAVDGAFMRANASKNQLISKKTVVKDLEKIDEKIEAYLETMAFEDNQNKKEKKLRPPINNLAKMKKRKVKLDKDLALLEEMGVTQYNRTDPDAKIMRKYGYSQLSYNSQIAVDNTYKFIVATEITPQGNDMRELHKMAMETKKVVGDKVNTTIVADAGYYSANELRKCQEDKIEVIVPVPNTGKVQKDKGFYSKDDFTYDKKHNHYICPNQQILTQTKSSTVRNNNITNYFYRAGSKTCNACPLRDKCIPQITAYKRVSRTELAEMVELHATKMKTYGAKKIIKKRGSIVEHPFGTIKQSLGWSHFLVRGYAKVEGENALIMLTYNFRRLLNLIGIALFRKVLLALKDGNIDDIKAEIVAYIAYFRICILYIFQIMNFTTFRRKKCYYLGY